jgi:hypothetical protein
MLLIACFQENDAAWRNRLHISHKGHLPTTDSLSSDVEWPNLLNPKTEASNGFINQTASRIARVYGRGVVPFFNCLDVFKKNSPISSTEKVRDVTGMEYGDRRYRAGPGPSRFSKLSSLVGVTAGTSGGASEEDPGEVDLSVMYQLGPQWIAHGSVNELYQGDLSPVVPASERYELDNTTISFTSDGPLGWCVCVVPLNYCSRLGATCFLSSVPTFNFKALL